MKINNVNIGPRLALSFGTVLMLMIALAAVGIMSMARIQGELDHILDDNVRKVKLANEMSDSVHIVARVIRTLVILADEAAIKEEQKKILAARTRYDAAFGEVQRSVDDEAGKALVTRITQARQVARPLNDKVIELALANKDQEASELLTAQAGPATDAWQQGLAEYVKHQEQRSKVDAAAARSAYDTALMLMIALSAVALVFGVAVAWLITRSIARPLNQAMKVAQTVATGDLTQQIRVDGKDESARLLQALKDMNESLVRIVGEVRVGSDTIATASGEIAAGNLDLSSRTEQQASSLEETASSMEELTSTVKQNADNARQANGLAQTASDVAVRGGDVVAQVVGTMGSINESSRKIVDIIGVIDGIAFQTNILALNAAVEAARAGEQGRGFAVVASEVRNLAQRSAAAAKEIKTLISDSVEKVDAGSKLVEQAGATMEEVVESIKRVTDIMGEITAATHEQTAGIEQINQAIAQMDQVTQQNASLVEEAAAAAASMQDQSKNLAQVVSVFKLDGMHATPARAAVQAAPKPAVSRKLAAAPLPVRALPAGQGDDWEQF
ncbi:HAMP domain-containing protein [Herbaspirillum sp. HC18]|nr:HAMP domain-containing protein [Herbaspirillum sp. HC18]